MKHFILRVYWLVLIGLVISSAYFAPIAFAQTGTPKADPDIFLRDDYLDFDTISIGIGTASKRFDLINNYPQNTQKRINIARIESLRNPENVVTFSMTTPTLSIEPKMALICFARINTNNPQLTPGLKNFAFTVLVDTIGNGTSLKPLELTGQVFVRPALPAVSLAIPDSLSAKVGDTVDFPIILANSVNIQNVENITCRMQFNATMLWAISPAGSTSSSDFRRYENGNCVVTLSSKDGTLKKAPYQINDTIAILRCVSMLGNAIATPIRVSGEITGQFGGMRQIPERYGLFTTENVYYQDGIPRLYNPLAGNLELTVSPNPVEKEAQIQCAWPLGTRPSLRIIDRNGAEVLDVSSVLPQSAQKIIFSLSRQYFPAAGLYFLRLSTQNSVLTRAVIVQ